MNVRSAVSYDRKGDSARHANRIGGKSRTLQSQKDDADINVIMKRFGVTGLAPNNVRAPTYGDFTDAMDFRESMDAIRAAKESFMQMPAAVRKRFANDPQLFVEFCSDKKNLDEMRALGLAIPEVIAPEVKATEVVIVDDKREPKK